MDIEDLGKRVKNVEIISASRRTDIPAFYLYWFIKCIKQGYVDVPNPYNNSQISRISLDPKIVKCIAWWSKDYSKWLEYNKKHPEIFSQYCGHLFNFTLNSDSDLERGVKLNYVTRLKQLDELVGTFGPHAINLRFDPIVFWKSSENPQGKTFNNLRDFKKIIGHAGKIGINSVTFSFCIPYGKAKSNMLKRGKILVDLSLEDKYKILDVLLKIALDCNVEMQACCDSGLVGYNGKSGGVVGQGSCISKEKIQDILEGKATLKDTKKDSGQRKECTCVLSRDIGNYNQVCYHSCDYCYANPSAIIRV